MFGVGRIDRDERLDLGVLEVRLVAGLVAWYGHGSSSGLAAGLARFRFRLSEPASVKIRLERKPRRGRRGAYRKVAVLTRRGRRTGQNSVRFSGRIKRRALAPGAYRATIRAVDAAGNPSRACRVSFTIAR